MQGDFQFAVTIVTIFAGIFIRHNGEKQLRVELQRFEDRLGGRLDKVLAESKSMRNIHPELNSQPSFRSDR